MDFVINEKRAIEVAKKAVSMLEAKLPPFDKPDVMPDAIVPNGVKVGSLEHSLLLFYACSIDSMRSAQKVYKGMRDVAEEVRLDWLQYYTEEFISNLIDKHLESPGGINSPAETLSYNAMKLFMEYAGDPRRLHVGSIDNTLKEIQKFKEVGPGIAALITKNFVRFGIWDFSPYEIPIKVDRHVIRISIGSGVVELPPDVDVIRSDQLVKPLINAYRKITSKKHISAVDLDDALWGIGSNLCVKNDSVYCELECGLGCKIKPKADSRATWFHPNIETRLTGVLPYKKM